MAEARSGLTTSAVLGCEAELQPIVGAAKASSGNNAKGDERSGTAVAADSHLFLSRFRGCEARFASERPQYPSCSNGEKKEFMMNMRLNHGALRGAQLRSQVGNTIRSASAISHLKQSAIHQMAVWFV
jgi:hypothetical protein